MIEQAVRKLIDDAGLGATVHYYERPQDGSGKTYPLPAIVIQRQPTRRLRGLDGPTGIEAGAIRVSVLAGDYLATADLAGRVVEALDGHTGDVVIPIDTSTTHTVCVNKLHLLDADDMPTKHRDAKGRTLTHGRDLDFDAEVHRNPTADSNQWTPATD